MTYTWNWQGSGASSRVLITENYGTDQANDDSSGTGNIVLTAPGCNITAPQTINYVYYVKNAGLYRKTITSQTYPATCGGSVQQKRTCFSGVNNPTYCQGNDALIVSNVSNFSVDYYTAATDSTPLDSDGGTPPHTKYSAGTGSAIPGSARSIVISLTLTQGNGNNATSTMSQLRITRKNGS